MNTKDIQKLIKVCRAAGVSELKFAGLEVKFGAGEADEVQSQRIEPPTAAELTQIEEDLTEKDRLDAADEDLSLMMVENPSLFEDLLVQRELEPSGRVETEGIVVD